MQCASKAEFGLMGTLIFSGWASTAFLIPWSSDLYGRKPILLINIAVQLAFLIVMIFTKSYWVMCTCLFFIGMCSSARWSTSYVYLMEFLTESNIKKVGPFVNASAALAFVIGASILQFLTKQTVVIEYIALAITLITLLLVAFFLPESPKWLVNKGRKEEAAQAYAYIARINRRPQVAASVLSWKFSQQTVPEESVPTALTDDFRPAIQQTGDDDDDFRRATKIKVFKGKLSELWHYRTLRWNLLILVFCWSACSMGFYVLAYVLKYLNGSIFLNAYSSSFGEILGKLSTVFLLRCISIKRVFLLAFGVSSVGMMLLILCGDNDELVPWILGFARIGFSQAFVAAYLGAILYYPTILASSAIGVCVTISKSATILAPIIAEVDAPINLIILLVIAVSACVVSQCMDTEKYEKDSAEKAN
uniref:Major facilitator superfamily (MFS) profile domain-containing protein n=1 Tax=Favella ehrenbergii TaxID=182087 RepID=A0A7S3HVQ1_9SPIT|mmetsp:Transcript_14366/g.18153  ORF Transcript_14366/g.18153 Transcript_14366/m.18153 type:complete len:420 (+) Transcript_14366:243-1502(+)